MDSSEETTLGDKESAPAVAVAVAVAGMKRKRTKRLPAPPPPQNTTSSAEFSCCSTDEDEDMANCLILLASGGIRDRGPPIVTAQRKLVTAPPPATGGVYVYECKTCNKTFPSFQALGGHRASHKKPKLVSPLAMVPYENKQEVDPLQISLGSFPNPKTPGSSLKAKVHECSICGVEFSSGQALGGHMRRHRPLNPALPSSSSQLPSTVEDVQQGMKERKFLSLDLNLPAPSDDGSEFLPPRPLLFSASALVDCHY